VTQRQSGSSRRDFLKTSGRIAGATAIAAAAIPGAYAAEENTINIALVGCGGRGTGAVVNALSVKNGPIRLVAMADVFENRLNGSFNALQSRHAKQIEKVTDERKFLGFDAYKEAMDCLDPGDIVILTTPCVFRWVHYTYAIERGLNVFMEKPVTTDAPTTRRILDLNKKAVEKNLKVAVGLMCRHCLARRELFDRIQNGEIGDVTVLRAYRMAGPTGSAATPPKPEGISDLAYQISKFHGFLWLSGGAVSDFLIHNIDECCWMKDAWPVNVKATGGRHYRGDYIDQNFDHYSMEYTFGDGTKMYVDGRTIPSCHQEFATYAHGTKGVAVVSSRSHSPARSRIYKGHNLDKKNLVWSYPQPEPNPYQLEWNDLIAAVREDQAYNEVERGAMVSLVTSMGRMAAHTGRFITLEEMLEHDHEFAPNADKLTGLDAESPLKPDENGKYPVPMPGITKKREYLDQI
jgi:predicted dehydrogenase